MMAEAFMGLVRGDFNVTVNHKDGNKLNNSIPNFEIITRKENINHAFETGLYSSAHQVSYLGVKYRSKTAMRRELGIGAKRQNKLISEGEIKLI